MGTTAMATTAGRARALSAGIGWGAAGVLVIIAFVMFGLLSEAFAPAPSGPADSSYATTADGVAAWAELLSRGGHPVSALRAQLASAALPSNATLVAIGAGELSSAESRNLARFVSAGGTLVIGGGNPQTTAKNLLPSPPRWIGSGSSPAVSTGSAPETAGVRTVVSTGGGTLIGGSGRALLLRPTGGALLTVSTLGAGKVELLADPSPLENRLLAAADNAQLALNLAGAPGRVVLFAEEPHGFGETTGLAAIPGRWWVAFGGLIVAGMLWALSRARRLGPPELPAPLPTPARSAYVESLASALVRAGDKESLTALARSANLTAGDVAANVPPRQGANRRLRRQR